MALIPLVGTQSSLSLTHTEIEETRERIREIYFIVFTHTHEIVITEPFIEAIGTLGSYNYHLRDTLSRHLFNTLCHDDFSCAEREKDHGLSTRTR